LSARSSQTKALFIEGVWMSSGQTTAIFRPLKGMLEERVSQETGIGSVYLNILGKTF